MSDHEPNRAYDKPLDQVWRDRLRPTFPTWGVDELCYAMSVVRRHEKGKAKNIRVTLQKEGLFSRDLVVARAELDVLSNNYFLDEATWNRMLSPRKTS